MPSALLTPRPEPGHVLPALGGGVVLALTLPVFIVAGWPVKAWMLATVLFAAVHALTFLVAHARGGPALRVFGVFFKSLGLLVVLVAVAASAPNLALATALTYALAYTAELGMSLAAYFGSELRR